MRLSPSRQCQRVVGHAVMSPSLFLLPGTFFQKQQLSLQILIRLPNIL